MTSILKNKNRDYLDRIADHVQVRGESRPEKQDLPKRVLDIVVLVEEIEKLILPPTRSELLKEIQNLSTHWKFLSNLVGDIERELGRATGRPVNTRLPIEKILPETKAIVNSLESIQREVRPEGHERIPLTQLGQHIRQILDDYYDQTRSSSDILKRISRRIDPTNPETSNFEDLPSKVALLVNNQASKQDDIREKRTPNSERMDSKYGSETEGKMKRWTDRVNALEGSVEEYRQREEKMKNAAKESNDLLTKAVEKADQFRTTVDAKQIEIEKMKATEIDLRHSQASLKAALDEAKQHLRTTLGAKQVEIQKLKATEKNLRDSNAGDMKRAENEKDNAIAEAEKRHDERIEKLTAKYAGELTDQKTGLERQHEAQRIALEKQNSQNLAEQRSLHSSALGRAEVDKIEQLDVLRKEHNRQVTESEKTWKFKFARVVRDHEVEEIEWEEALRLEEARRIKEVEEEAQKYKLVIETLKTELRVEKARTAEKVEEEAQKHKSTIEKLEMRCQKLQGILLKQDDYSGLTDLEIVRGVTSKTGEVSTVGFTTIVSKVTTFSEWEWRENREIWPKEIMAALVGTKQRRLKKLILGDAIWSTLFQLIFCSPFRILGKEGEHLEADWNGSFPSDDDETSNEYSWPTPTVISEKYRWESCEAALDSLTKQSSPYSPLRSSFINHQTQFQKRFLETVEAYVDLTEKREQDLLEFLTEAVRMWIVLCTQRYRIRMILPGSNESDPNKKLRLAQEQNDLKFTVAPRLQRHGNAKGSELEEVSVIPGCDGKMAAVYES